MAPELRFPRRYEYRETQRDVFVRQEKRIWRERWADKKTDPRQTQKAFLESRRQIWDPDLDGLDIETQKQLKDKYIDDFVKSYHGNPDADDQEWRCYAMLGSGGFGIIGLWVAVDESNNVTDRMVVKQVSRRQFEFKGHNGPHHWNDALLWHESPFLRYSHEAHVHRILNMRPSPALVGYRSDVVYKQKEAIRIFLDFCSHGDLWDLNNKYGYYRDQQRISSTNVTLPIRAQYPPEPFLWFLMLKLIDACIALEHIPQELVQKEIVHRDIKFENVYLSAPEPDWPHYPAPKLGDFGLAIFTGPEDNNNPVQYLGPGTPGWMAPEQLGSPYKLEHPQLDQAGNPMRLDARTNVWTIGLLIWAFALGHDSPPEPSIRVRMTMTRNPASDAFRKLYPFDPWPYSIQLQEIIRLCMEFDPADRAGPQEVRDLLQSHMDHAHLFPHQWPDELKAEYQNLGVHLQERYRISTPVSPNRLQGTAEEDDEQPRRRRRGIAEDDEQPRKRRRMARTAY
ncbi:MAG: hypothetical protein M1822_005226 [Bathelium mastoideum]|nr:MAG: hypothetical protein M1822_005226 [Bathelium mastoideum]